MAPEWNTGRSTPRSYVIWTAIILTTGTGCRTGRTAGSGRSTSMRSMRAPGRRTAPVTPPTSIWLTTLIPYVKECGYNYVEFLPLTEYPCDESWGYQASCFYSPTSRYGSAEELMQMVDRFHQNGIGVILDIVPGHFAVDSFGLKCYDGTCVYEYPFPDVQYNEWGSLNFNLSRNDVRSFLFSAANYWIDRFPLRRAAGRLCEQYSLLAGRPEPRRQSERRRVSAAYEPGSQIPPPRISSPPPKTPPNFHM